MNKPTWNYILNDLALYSLFVKVAYSEDVTKQDKTDLEHQIKLLQQKNKELQTKVNQLKQANKSLRGNIKAISKTSNNRHLEIKRLLKKIEKLEFYKTILEANQYCPYDKDCGKLYDCTKEEYQKMCEANIDLMAKIDQLETNRDEAIKEIKYFELQADHLDDSIYLDKTLSNKIIEKLERGKEC